MIAPLPAIHQEQQTAPPGMRHARKTVAATLLQPHDEPRRDVVRIAAWRAWALVLWMIVASIAYYAALFAGN